MNKLLQAIQVRRAPVVVPYPPKCKVNPLLKRLELQKGLSMMENDMLIQIKYLRGEVKFIIHLQRCWICQTEAKLDVERYGGSRHPWFLHLEFSDYLEKRYPSCPKERAYRIGSYFEQLKYYEKHGTAEAPGENTLQFILDRAKWAYKKIGRQIRICRQILHMVKAWDFTEGQMPKLEKLYNQLVEYL
jgi:hypothetical protein